MPLPPVNILAVLVSGAVIFALGGLWYSPALFSKRWVALMGKTEEQMRAAASSSPTGFMFQIGALCWLFAGATSFANSLFSMHPRGL